MGEMAEMMLSGIMCQCCGVYLDVDEECGFPMSCDDCGEGEVQIKKPRISASERKIRKRTLWVIRKNFKYDMLKSWKYFLPTRFMDYIRESRNSKEFEKIVIKYVKEYLEINEIIPEKSEL